MYSKPLLQDVNHIQNYGTKHIDLSIYQTPSLQEGWKIRSVFKRDYKVWIKFSCSYTGSLTKTKEPSALQGCPGFKLWSLCLFPMTIAVTLRAPDVWIKPKKSTKYVKRAQIQIMDRKRIRFCLPWKSSLRFPGAPVPRKCTIRELENISINWWIYHYGSKCYIVIHPSFHYIPSFYFCFFCFFLSLFGSMFLKKSQTLHAI